ncbi:MAG: hypothetical protein IJK62_10070 [Bacteroidales bacterium]|nr:hypothetical protein [Bacteroidales bacterium]
MKRLVLISLLVAAMGVMAFVGCEREQIEPNNGQPQRANEDSLINQQKIEHWRIVDENVWYFDTIDSTPHRNPYTYGYLDIYLLGNILHWIDADSTDSYVGSNRYDQYSLNGDTITIINTSGVSIYPQPDTLKYFIYRENDTIMKWHFLFNPEEWASIPGVPHETWTTFYFMGEE